MHERLDMFNLTRPVFQIDKPIRLIELFAGIGSQAMVLRDLGANFEHYRVVEFDRFAVASYNAIHGTYFETTDICNVGGADLGICDTDKFCYVMTYSFPCQDLSTAGKRKGMTKGSGTRSGLLWEVERLLNECSGLPQVLLMENVPQVHSKANMPDFQKWIGFLESKGYSNYWQDLNAKDYGVAQNRARCFMVSLLGEWNYKFPKPILLERELKDYLEDKVDEKYYINNEKAQKLIQTLISNQQPAGNGMERAILTPKRTEYGKAIRKAYESGEIKESRHNMTELEPRTDGISNTITTVQKDNLLIEQHGLVVVEMEVKQIGNMDTDRENFKNPQCGRVYNSSGLSPAINTCQGGQKEPKIIVAMRGRNPDNPSDRTAGSPTEQRLEPNSQGVCNTLTSVQKDNMVLEKADFCIGGLQEHQTARFDGISPSLTAAMGMGGGQTPLINCQYRIRKLTPLERWRLMGFSDEDFHKAEEVNSNTQLYKQAGNSIVKNVLIAIFGQMIHEKENLYKV